MDTYPWWTEEQKAFALRVNRFVEEIMPRDAESRWKREFPWDIFKRIGAEGFTGAGVPKEYNGLGLGATGACIAAEAFNRMPGIGRVFGGNMLGGLRQVMEFGTEDQKRRILPRIAAGDLGAIVITEPFAGTDAAAMEMTAKREGDDYLLNGKKRFIVSAGVADRYMVYARTSDDPGDRKSHRHLTAFIVEKGTPGFTTEKINEIIGFENIQNGVLHFEQVRVSPQQVIAGEGDGWKVMTAGLNFERSLICSQVVGWMRELLRNVVPYAQRRVQFGKRTIDFVNNRFKIADITSKLKIARLLTYYTAYLWDQGRDTTLESNIAKVFNCEGVLQASLDAIQVMGGDGVTPFYPLSAIMNVAKVENIAGGTIEACRMVIFRTAIRQMADELRMPRRVIHEELGVPVPANGVPDRKMEISEDSLLKILAEDYRVNPGLHMSREDLTEHFDVREEELDQALMGLEEKGLARIFRDKRGIALAKATYEGLGKAFPLEHYQWFPDWVKEKNIF